MYKVVFHVDEMSKWGLTMNNVRNFTNESSESELVIVANAEAVQYLDESLYDISMLKALIDDGVKVYGCSTAIEKLGVNRSNILEGVKLASGVVTLAKKQAEGYAYIRP
mgnify:CR=1 FL=1